MEVLFKTPHGSHLYGLNHEGSDEDFYTVVAPVKRRKYKYSKQTIHDGVDSVVVDLGTWLRLCEKGVPQALEAMFSTAPIVDEIAELRASYVAGSVPVRETYARTITNFVMSDEFKRRRHAVRLAFNLNDLLRYGKFNPCLSVENARWAGHMACSLDNEDLLELCWDTAYNR